MNRLICKFRLFVTFRENLPGTNKYIQKTFFLQCRFIDTFDTVVKRIFAIEAGDFLDLLKLFPVVLQHMLH